jgi:hypothetical protein
MYFTLQHIPLNIVLDKPSQLIKWKTLLTYYCVTVYVCLNCCCFEHSMPVMCKYLLLIIPHAVAASSHRLLYWDILKSQINIVFSPYKPSWIRFMQLTPPYKLSSVPPYTNAQYTESDGTQLSVAPAHPQIPLSRKMSLGKSNCCQLQNDGTSALNIAYALALMWPHAFENPFYIFPRSHSPAQII